MSDENMNQNETVALLQQIKDLNKKRLFYSRCIMIIFIVFCIILISIVPTVVSTLNTAQYTMEHLNQTISKTDEALDSVMELADTSASGMQNALEKINAIDIDSLNKGIEDLNTVIEPMANFFGRFQK